MKGVSKMNIIVQNVMTVILTIVTFGLGALCVYLEVGGKKKEDGETESEVQTA